MKQAVAASLLLPLLPLLPRLASGQYDTSIPSPVCAKFKQFTVTGTGEFVDTDGSGIVPQTTGDMSVSFSLTGVTASGEYPNQSYFRNIDLDMNAVCIVKRDQPAPPAPPADAPVCLYEAEMTFCRNYIIFPVDVAVEKVASEKVVPSEKIQEALRQLEEGSAGGRRLTTQRGNVRGGEAERADATEAERADEAGQGERELQLFKGRDEVQAVKVTDEVKKLDPALIELICPQLGCFIPYRLCTDTRKGGFTAHGTGSSDIKITGGTADLFGAFGQILTPPSGITILTTDFLTGDITYEFDITIEICYYRRESGFW